MFHRTSQFRIAFLAGMCLVLLASVCQAAAETVSKQATKLYSPFDEKAPKMPAEFDVDKRLDVKVDIAVKSTNMKDLFREISRATGVNVVVAKELSGERPIIFFHDKPLRQVMIEVSRLYGYLWLAKGQRGAWTYELFEDVVHAKRRDQVRGAQEAAQVEALLECIDQVSRAVKSDAALEQLRRANPRLYRMATDPRKGEMLSLVSMMDKTTIRSCMNDVGISWDWAAMSAEMQSGVVKAINCDYTAQEPSWEALTADRLQKGLVRFKRDRFNVFTPPHIMLVVSAPKNADGTGGGRWWCAWPGYEELEPDLLNLPDPPAGRVIGDPLPKDVKIDIEQKHKVFHYGAILVQDVLDAIARQARANIIADYYYQDTPMPAYSDMPLDKLVAEICLRTDYTCQVEKDTLRFKCNKWYLQPLQEEPAMTLQEHLWRRIFETGGLSLEDLLDIACLRDRQTLWGGFRLIPHASQARLFPTTARTVRTLGWILEDQACTPEGLSVSRLDSRQFIQLVEWGRVMGIRETPEDLFKSTIRIEKSGDPMNRLNFILALPDGTLRNITLAAQVQVYSEEDRRTLAAERAAELAADKVELSAQ